MLVGHGDQSSPRVDHPKVKIPKGITKQIKAPCAPNCMAYCNVTATGRGIGIEQHCCFLGCKPAAKLRYYLHGDDSVTVELM